MIPFEDIVKIDRDGPEIQICGTEIIFTHVSHTTGIVRHFAVERMEKVWQERGYDIKPIAVDFEMWNMVRLNFGIEQHRLNRLDARACLRPTLWVELPEKPDDPKSQCTAIMVDGAHRLTYAYGILGWNRIPGVLFPVGDWEEFLIDIPKELSDLDVDRIQKACDGGPQFWSGIK